MSAALLFGNEVEAVHARTAKLVSLHLVSILVAQREAHRASTMAG